ncbi:MAG TPA: RraA family protein [Xanthobacteraceae bacterium]|nr:RraA family protein [Xanthobacteraceae bacterium]
MIADEAVARLEKLDTCAVSDALDRLNLRGAVLGVGPLWPCPRIAGRCVTVKIKPAGLERPKQHLCTSAIAAAKEGDVIVVDNGGRIDVAAWGGLLSLAAQVRQLRGVIVDGACRDLDESRELNFPVYGRAAVQVTARGRIMQQSFNEEIAFAGVQVHPGDLVIADASGVVFVPRSKEMEVLAQAEVLAEREAAMAAAIRAGRSVFEVMETMGYEAMLADGERKP